MSDASILYGAPAAAPVPTPAPAANSAAQALYGASTPVVQKTDDMTDGDHQRAESAAAEAQRHERMLEQTYVGPRDAIETAALDRLGLQPNEAAAAANEWTGRFHALGITSSEADNLVHVAVGALATPDADRTSWAPAARTELQREFNGGGGASRALDAARALVAKDPALAQWLDATGLGNHPAVVRTIASKAWNMRKAGRL